MILLPNTLIPQSPFQDKAEAYLIIQLDGESIEQLEDLYEKVGEILLNNDAMDVFVADNRTDSENIWKVRQEFAEGIRAADPYVSFSGDVVVPLSKVPEMMKEIEKIGKKYNMKIATGRTYRRWKPSSRIDETCGCIC